MLAFVVGPVVERCIPAAVVEGLAGKIAVWVVVAVAGNYVEEAVVAVVEVEGTSVRSRQA